MVDQVGRCLPGVRHRTSRLGWRDAVAVASLSTLALVGCSARAGTTLTNRFVSSGEPQVVIGESVSVDSELFDRDAKPPPLEELEVVPPRVVTPAATRLEDADQALATALARAGAFPSPETHRRVATLYERHHVWDMAYDHLRAAERLDRSDAATQDRLARLWRSWGLPQLGLGAAYRAVNLAPDSPEARNTLGTLLDAVGHSAEAQRAFEHALTLAPGASYALNNLCYLAWKRGAFEEALAACRAAIAADSDLPAAHNNLALVHMARGNTNLIWTALQEGGPFWTALYNLGIAHLATGKPEAAAAAFAATSRAQPQWADARRRAKRVHEQLLMSGSHESTVLGDSRSW